MSTRDFDTISYIGPEELDGNSGELMIDKANVLSDALSDLVKENVKIIVFEKHVKSIGSEAFEGCPNLEAVYFNHGVDEIGYGAFMGCPNLATLDLVGEPDLQYLRENRKLLNSNLSGRRYSVIGDYAFAGCESLSEIDLDSVLIIGEHAFEGCTSLQSIENLNNPRLIGSQAFAGTPVKSLEITSDKCLISKGAFADCKDLTSLDMLVGQLTILENAFHNCKNLHNFTGKVHDFDIDPHAFEGANNIRIYSFECDEDNMSRYENFDGASDTFFESLKSYLSEEQQRDRK